MRYRETRKSWRPVSPQQHKTDDLGSYFLLIAQCESSRDMVDVLLETAVKSGYNPNFTVGGDEVENGMGYRPTPFMIQVTTCR